MANPDKQSEQGNDFESRLKQARSKSQEQDQSSAASSQSGEHSAATQLGMRAATEIAVNPIAGALIGYGIDWLLHSLPAFTLIMGFVGFGYGIFRAQGIMNGVGKNSEPPKK